MSLALRGEAFLKEYRNEVIQTLSKYSKQL